jgi:hypothetical protein
MDAQEFKIKIKEIKENLRGITIQFVSKYSIKPLRTLKEFGEAILEQEKFGNSFCINQVWTNNGIVIVKSFKDFESMLKVGMVTGVRVVSYYEPKNKCELIRSFGSLD